MSLIIVSKLEEIYMNVQSALNAYKETDLSEIEDATPHKLIELTFKDLKKNLLVIRRILDQDMFVSLLATFGLSLLMQQVINRIFGPEVQTVDMQLPVFDAFDNMVTIPSSKLIALGLAAIIAIAVVLFMKKSRTGQAIRATAQDPRAARVLGINIDRVYAFTFAFNSALCGAAGVLVSIIFVIQPFYGITYSMGSFAIVTAAGLGNLPAVIISAFGIASCLYKILNDGTAITIKIKQGINVHNTSTATLCVLFDGIGFADALNLMQA